jgi:6-phosphogluconolactonase
MASLKGQLHILADRDALNAALADFCLRISQQAIDQRGRFTVALAGGSTPRHLYQILAKAPYRDAMAWDKVWVYFGDERSVPRDHPESNFNMAREALLSHVPIPSEQIFPMVNPALEAGQNAQRYGEQLRDTLPLGQDTWPVFDLVLLGMGDDGHTASLFPNTDILHQDRQSVAAVYVDKLATWRVSLTYPCINHARHVAVLVAGEGKAQTLQQVAQAKPGTFPIQGIAPQTGELHWFMDRAAAALLPEGGDTC